MIELVHDIEPTELSKFRADNPTATPKDFNSAPFHPIKLLVKRQLNRLQGGMCVYCEKDLLEDSGQVEHIKPKSGPRASPSLAFVYTNYAHSCINENTCGQKKKAGVLPIEPGPGCNDLMILNTDGTLEPLESITRKQKHDVKQTRDMLGLQHPDLVRDRESWIKQIRKLISIDPTLISPFLVDKPFRYILRRFVD